METDYRLLITGSRRLHAAGRQLLLDRLAAHLGVARIQEQCLVVVQGDCPSGADRDARAWGWMMKRGGYPVEVESHPAKSHPTQDFGDWPYCGPKRNKYMVGLGADHCEAFIDACTSIRCRRLDVHGSHGASGCAELAEAAKIPTTKWDLWKT